MADDEPYVRRSVKDLAAGLNHGEVARVPATSKPPKPLPSVKPKFVRSVSTEVSTAPVTTNAVGNLPDGGSEKTKPVPRLPGRRPTDKTVPEVVAPVLPGRTNTQSASTKPPVPGLPPRRPTEPPSLPVRRPSDSSTVSSRSDAPPVPTLPPRRPTDGPALQSRRKSQQSLNSDVSASSGSRIKAPEFDASKLPPLPPKRTPAEKDVDSKPPALPGRGNTSSPAPPPPSRTPKLPSRPVPNLPERPESTPPTQPPRRLPPRDASVPRPAPLPSRPVTNGTSNAESNGVPPPVPTSTRPDLSKIMATKPKFDAATPAPAPIPSSECLRCRDFSGPDNHAAKFPRQHVTSVQQLARDLTSPFPSSTDKARAIFTWCYHNIAYDCDAFFNSGIRAVTPMDTIRKGAGVCSGYAGLYADIAIHAGLECVVVGGHGKGYGYSPLKPGQPLPPEQGGHAWNAVKMDMDGPYGNGHMAWKLLDACWGAGNVGDDKRFHQDFKPHQFTMTNEDFGRTHWPEDKRSFFRADGRNIPWAEYYIGDAGAESCEVFADEKEGISKSGFVPKLKAISTDASAHAATGGMIRFQFQRVCEHWNPEVHGRGKDYVYALACGVGKWEPFQCNGTYWWCDVPVDRLGKKGEQLNLWVINTINGEDARGVTQQQYMEKQGRAGMSFMLVARWDLV